MSSKKAARPDLRMVVNNPDEPAAEHAAAVSPEQVEMPFAMVHGEPVTQLPKDLYIPPQALEVFLEAFEGNHFGRQFVAAKSRLEVGRGSADESEPDVARKHRARIS